jgi:major membrane immunogen (membrane-anchored lipoprotein)
MSKIQDKDTRYFVEINLKNLKIIKCGFDQKENLNKGKQNDPTIHRLFLTRGQYAKLVERCSKELAAVIESG